MKVRLFNRTTTKYLRQSSVLYGPSFLKLYVSLVVFGVYTRSRGTNDSKCPHCVRYLQRTHYPNTTTVTSDLNPLGGERIVCHSEEILSFPLQWSQTFPKTTFTLGLFTGSTRQSRNGTTVRVVLCFVVLFGWFLKEKFVNILCFVLLSLPSFVQSLVLFVLSNLNGKISIFEVQIRILYVKYSLYILSRTRKPESLNRHNIKPCTDRRTFYV